MLYLKLTSILYTFNQIVVSLNYLVKIGDDKMNILNELDEIIKTQNISTVFQPIISLRTGETLGYEALSRGPKDSPLHMPEKLFKAAEDYKKTWELELACRIKAIERSRNIPSGKLLFLNVDPKIIKDKNFKKGLTKDFLLKNNISPETIIFEITEKTAILDYKSFTNVLNNYTNQGYKIAIDDTGSGYSGLKTISETKPNYIKIDIDLIRNIDSDSFKQSLIKAFVSFTKSTKINLIAEGIETKEELKTLIDLGVYAGQGFFLKRPCSDFTDTPFDIKNIIVNYNELKATSLYSPINRTGDIAQKYTCFDSETLSATIKNYFSNYLVSGACIVEDNIPVGLVMKHTLDSMLATQYGLVIFSKRPVSLIMDRNALIVDYNIDINETARLAMERPDDRLYDYVVVTRENKYYGIVTIKTLLEFKIAIEKEQAKELNPLTSLPGNSVIERIMCKALTSNINYGVLYFDLDNFKVYNDNYGFENGDRILLFTANLINNTVNDLFPINSFVGHIGGDDFVCIIETSYENLEILSKLIIDKFDEKVVNFFNEIDQNNKYIKAYDRKGNEDIFNLTSISIAGIYGNIKKFDTSSNLALHVSTIKKKSKLIKKSSFVLEKLE